MGALDAIHFFVLFIIIIIVVEVIHAFNNFCCSFQNLHLFLHLYALLNIYTKTFLSRAPQREIEWFTVLFSNERNTLTFIIADTLLYSRNMCRQESMDKVIQHCVKKACIWYELPGHNLQMKDKTQEREVFLPCSCFLLLIHVLWQYAEESRHHCRLFYEAKIRCFSK